MDDQQISDKLKTVLDQMQDILNQTVRTTVMLDALYMDITIPRRDAPDKE